MLQIASALARIRWARMALQYPVLLAVIGFIMITASTAQAPGELIIQVRPGLSEQDVRQLSQRVGAEYVHALGGSAYLIKVTDAGRVAAVMQILRSQPDIVSVEPNQPVRIPE